MPDTITLAEARRLLKPPLKFGDDAQIRAVRFMEQVDAALEAYTKCDEKHEDYHEGLQSEFDHRCECIQKFNIEVRRAAYVYWKKKR